MKRARKFELLFEAEMLLSGAAYYLQHLHKITHEENYRDALRLVAVSLSDIESQRREVAA